MLSFAQRVGERLRTDTATTTKDAAGVYGDQLLPVLAARNATVDDLWAETQEPHIHHSRGPAISHHGGYAAGRFAADQADLGEELAMGIT